MKCRSNCGACCIAPSISSAIPGMLHGKKAGERCVQLTIDYKCKLFGKPDRPKVCLSISPSDEMCGDDSTYAINWLTKLEKITAPDSTS
jgi:Fe-S-cluster containining protein